MCRAGGGNKATLEFTGEADNVTRTGQQSPYGARAGLRQENRGDGSGACLCQGGGLSINNLPFTSSEGLDSGSALIA